MTTARPMPLTDDHGDQFPGAVPAPAPAPAQDPSDRLVRMHAAYVHKVNAVVAAGNDDLAHELADSFDQESAGRHGVRRPTAGPPDATPPAAAGAAGRRVACAGSPAARSGGSTGTPSTSSTPGCPTGSGDDRSV